MRTRGKTGKSEKWFCCILSECNDSLFFFFLKQLNHLSDQLAPSYNLQNLMRTCLHSFLARSIRTLLIFIAWQNHFEVNSIESTHTRFFYFLIVSLIFWVHYTSQYDMDVVRPVTTKIRKISSPTLYLCPARYLSAFLVRPGRERRLCVFSILARKKTLVDLDNQGIWNFLPSLLVYMMVGQ